MQHRPVGRSLLKRLAYCWISKSGVCGIAYIRFWPTFGADCDLGVIQTGWCSCTAGSWDSVGLAWFQCSLSAKNSDQICLTNKWGCEQLSDFALMKCIICLKWIYCSWRFFSLLLNLTSNETNSKQIRGHSCLQKSKRDSTFMKLNIYIYMIYISSLWFSYFITSHLSLHPWGFLLESARLHLTFSVMDNISFKEGLVYFLPSAVLENCYSPVQNGKLEVFRNAGSFLIFIYLFFFREY